jgi:mono/diheme cytochrome c family protein
MSSFQGNGSIGALHPNFVIAAAGLLLASPVHAADPPVEYLRDIKPLLTRSCVGCHGPEKQRGGLRLDSASALLTGGDSGPAVLPGNAAGSRLIRAVSGADGVAQMPPKEPRLSGAEIALFRAWIDAGARAPANEGAVTAKSVHWSFRPIKSLPAPSVRRSGWARNDIDRFILDRLEKEGIDPAPEADRATLLRRLSMDLIGLPPTPEQVDAFVIDAQADAYERQVDRLLASAHYGERWGRHWLDLARYADSNGYSIDSPRSIWPYRDWVIEAFNRDLPFDQFTIEQLAGDLLPHASTDNQVATGFHRNTQVNEEGGIDKEQFRVESVIDRVNTTGAVWLGLTVGCCQCHNHKFDPLSQRDYYQLFAFFNNQDEPNLSIKSKGTTMVLRERKIPRETHILMGGDFTRPGASATPGTPAVLPPLAQPRDKRAPTRLDLARWLVAPENPLTSRVLVNRLWGHYFGLGLVETENDFGTQGTPPTHAELLDWLASEMMSEGWSLKRMHRLIVTSATYRQSSAARPELAVRDPRNRLLARQGRLRLEAEAVRDAALAASGLLDEHLGGASIFPPQPAGVDQFTQVKRKWTPTEGPARYRRGLYTYFWRAAPHPALTAFDAPDAGTTCTRRNRSNTPLQALTLLNDSGFAEYAYGLAARLLREETADSSGRLRSRLRTEAIIHRAFRLCMGRVPEALEEQRLALFLDKERQHFAAHGDEASTLLAGGGPAGKKLDACSKVPECDRAALVMLARVLLNLDEFITRE